MSKHVILTLEYDLGDYSDREDDGEVISETAQDYEDSFFQSDVIVSDMKIVGVRIEVRP